MDNTKTSDIKEKREQMSRESWIRNVMRIYPEKTRQQTEELYEKLFGSKGLCLYSEEIKE